MADEELTELALDTSKLLNELITSHGRLVELNETILKRLIALEGRLGV